ncbi:MerR family transcriptional regulator [Rubinisphaera italica]|uniref:HTH merR-type domain-containing protein n=1 Tax=Rubinisphaera italica TaxID=2527969 RepID=A0A5C5XL51_9PLAN|nr:hypothetical protein Pan54_36210 [Rubinisphaera italica]
MNNCYTLRDVAKRIGIPSHRIVYLFTSGKVAEPNRVSGRRLFTEDDIQKIATVLGKEVPDA